MKLRKFAAMTMAVAMLGGTLAGCGGAASSTASSSADSTPAESTSTAESTETSGEKVNIKLFTGKIETIDVMNEIIDEFNASQDHIVVEQEYQKDASNVIKIKFASNEVPDIMTTYEQGFVDEGKYMDISDLNEFWDRMSPDMKAACTDVSSGNVYRICTNMTMAGFFYNKDILSEAGYTEFPTEWADFETMLETIKEKEPDVTPWFIFGSEAWHLGHLIEFLPHGYIKSTLGAVDAKKAFLANDQDKLQFAAADGPMAVFGEDLVDLQNKGLINADVLTATNDNCVQDFANGKAAMFSKRTIKPYIAVSRVDTASEALAVSIGEKACVDLGFMASLMGGGSDRIEQIKRDLAGVIFKDPESGDDPLTGWQTADEYLSGRVREKLKTARRAAEHDPAYAVNVESLEKVQPKDLTAGEIGVRLGTTWIPEDVIEDFTFELLGTPWHCQRRIHIRYSKVTGEWNVSEKSIDRSNIRAYNTYGTGRINAYKIIEDTLNLRDVRIFDTVQDADGHEQRVLNKKETAIAQDKQDLIKQKFQEWIWAEPSRRDRLCRIYNEKFNSIRPREYDGSHIVFAGMNPEKKLRPHQRNAVARAIYGGNALFGHVVGAGKTYEMIATAMEAKRLGLSNKSLFVVPNNIIGDFASDFLELYPSANILMATKKDFEKQNRKKFCARIATGDYDGIIIGHSQFEKIPLSTERQQAMLKKQIAEVVAGIAAAKRQEGSRFTVKQMEKSKKSLEAKLKKLNDQSRKDDVVTFEELGVDRLFIDEADMFKNLYLYTKMRNVGGISQTEALKASDLYMKCRYLDELTSNKGVVFATGTPVSNSMAEMYTMQRYLQYDTLERLELTHFDSWAAQFGETVTSMELKPEGKGFQQKTRFANFYNLPELMAIFKEVADIQTADMLNLPVPKANYETVVCKPSEMQKEMVSSLAERADAVRSGAVDPSVDNMLLITNDGRKLALDQRLLNPMLPDFEGSKVNVCAGNIYRIWEDTKEQRLTQLVFCDLSTPKNDGTFSVYNDLRDKLIARGIPAEEIAFVHDANNEAQKKELFAKVRRGKIRVLFGSTPRMGAGTNVQDRLIALHDLDCPWRPRDLEQRSGRIIRQGNQNPEVQIYRYVTEGTFDSYLYQMVENKQRFISQVFTSKSPARVMQEIDDAVLSYNEIKALATGNPMIIEHANLETEVNKLKMLNASHLSQRYELEDKILKYYPQEISRLNERISGYTADIARREENTPAKKEDFPPMQIHGTVYTEKAEAGKALIEACKQLTNSDPVSIGSYRGFEMQLFYEAFSKEYRVALKGALTHTASLGTDIHGNITRLDNALNGLETRLQEHRDRLENTTAQMEAAKADAAKPFQREQELQEKSKRLAELTKLLKMDEKDRELLDSAPDEGDEQPERKVVGLER